jgi:hypothetical protein
MCHNFMQYHWNNVSIPRRGKVFFSSPNRPDLLGCSSLCRPFNGYGNCLQGIKAGDAWSWTLILINFTSLIPCIVGHLPPIHCAPGSTTLTQLYYK